MSNKIVKKATYDHEASVWLPVEECFVGAHDLKIVNTSGQSPPPTSGTTFTSGAMRSEQKLPFWKLPLRAMIEWAKRFVKGEKYDIQKGMTHNWKGAIGTGDLQFIQEFYNHAQEHLLKAKELAEFGSEHADDEGETMFDHLGAVVWNAAALIEYLDKDPINTCRALSQRSEKL